MRLKYKFLKTFCLTLCFCLFMGTAAFADEEQDFSQGIETVVTKYLEDNNIPFEKIGIGWYDPTSGESWFLNGDEFMVAGSMYKLPLNMVYTDMLTDGSVQPDTIVGGYQVDIAMRLSIVNSDNEAAQALREGLSYDLKEYRNILAQYSGLDTDSLPDSYYTENRISPRFIINTLRQLYENSDHYAQLIDYMKQAHPDSYFKKYEAQLDYEIAHKYGSFENTLSDCGIIYTPRPFLLVVMTEYLGNGDEHLAQLMSLFADYSEYLDEQDAIAVELEAQRVAAEKAAEEARIKAELEEAERIAREKAEVEARLQTEFEQAEKERQESYEKAVADYTAALKAQNNKNIFTVVAAAAVLFVSLVLLFLSIRLRERKAFAKGCLLVSVLLFALLAMLPGFLQTEPAPAEPTPLLTIAPPEPTPESTSEPTPEPTPESKTEWTLSFAGDCTIGTLEDWQGLKSSSNMLHVIGNDYSYPFSAVKKYFESDDLTIVNMEGAFTDETQSKSKNYCFKAGTEYAKVFTEGCIEAVSLANNHSGDYLEAGIADTKAALDGESILYTDETSPIITQLEGGLKLGIVSFNCVEIDLAVGDVDGYLSRIEPMIDFCRDENCGIIVAFMHWGWEYRDEPEDWMVTLAHALADYGCDIVMGSHNHELLRSEDYNGVPIFYSLGNFCYGGHSNPDDKDSVIVQQRIVLENGEYKLDKLSLIPCSISHSQSENDFCPMPYNEGSEEYGRVLEKLNR